MRLGDATWRDVGAATKVGRSIDGVLTPVLLIPVGSTEQHGPHLPLSTDTLIAEEISGRAVHMTDGLMVGPTISVSSSGEHAGFPGTLSIGETVMANVVLELARSADWAAGVVFVNGHGGNVTAMQRAAEVFEVERRRVLVWWPRVPSGDPHAGHTETSIMLALAPDAVRLAAAQPGPVPTLDALVREGVRPLSPSGVLGDPTGADADSGRRILDDLADRLSAAVDAWTASEPS
jgi:mycofactocin system creatininase family protein